MISNFTFADILVEGLDDWVPVDQLLWLARESAESEEGGLKNAFVHMLEFLLQNDLVVIGNLGSEGFDHWEGSPSEVVERVVRGLEFHEWEPQGGLCWLANTEAGNAAALQYLDEHPKGE